MLLFKNIQQGDDKMKKENIKQATTVRMEMPIAELLKEIVLKRKSECASSKSNQSVTADAIRSLHKRECK